MIFSTQALDFWEYVRGSTIRTDETNLGPHFRSLVSGKDGYLRLIIRSYVPNVVCDPSPPFHDMHRCSAIRDEMRTSTGVAKFGRSGQPGVSERLPIGGYKISERMDKTSTLDMGFLTLTPLPQRHGSAKQQSILPVPPSRSAHGRISGLAQWQCSKYV